jgi:hypothetical protein
MAKILKNTTGSSIIISDTGVTIPASPGQYTIPAQDFSLWVASNDIISIINAGDIIVNDGVSDLTSSEGIRFLQYPDRVDIQKDDSDISKVNTIFNFEGALSVIDEGSGKTTINVLTTGDNDQRLISIRCIDDGNCDPVVSASILIDDDLCFLKKEQC